MQALLVLVVAVVARLAWQRRAKERARYVRLPDYVVQAADWEEGVAALLADAEVRTIDASRVRLGGRLGAGGMGLVRAAELDGAREVAAKASTAALSDAALAREFLREVSLTMALEHENVVEVHGLCLVEEEGGADAGLW